MSEPWFDVITWSWVPGTILGTLGGIMGGIGGTLASSGKARTFVITTWCFFLICAVVMLILGIVALSSGQPYGVWYGLILPGVMGTIVFGGLLPVLRIRYREAELRKMSAKDIHS